MSALSDLEQRDRLRLIRSPHVGPVTFRSLMARFGSASDALAALPELARRGGRKSAIKVFPAGTAEDEIATTEAAGARMLHVDVSPYPEALAVLPDAPPVLIVKGEIGHLEKPGLGIVGARNASAAGVRFTQTIAGDLGQTGFTIVSGLARGIDTAAHRGSLKSGTIAVMAGGIDVVYPPENQSLFELISEQGLIVCEMSIGTKPQARHFPRRNRLISGLSRGVLVVEAALRSGSLITARFAGDQGRDVFAVPGSPLDPRHRGTNDLIRNGAVLTESAEDIVQAMEGSLHSPVRVSLESTPVQSNLLLENASGEGAGRDVLLEKLGPTPTEIDELIRQTRLTPATVFTILLELELAGRLDRHPGNKVSLN
ncbi:MAG: DNA-processing protein DprA [Alphaproteobacteria bacterium]